MRAEREKVFCSGAFVERNQFFRVPLFRQPDMVNVLEAEFGGMAVSLDVVFIRRSALDMHVARIPVALFGNALRRPVRPDAELRVVIPVRVFVIFHE